MVANSVYFEIGIKDNASKRLANVQAGMEAMGKAGKRGAGIADRATEKLNAELERTKDKVKEVGGVFRSIGQVKGIFGGLQGGLTGTFQKIALAGEVIEGVTQITGVVKQGFDVVLGGAIDLEAQLAEVRTLLPDIADEDFADLRQGVFDLSNSIGSAADETVPALYQAISAGVPTDNVFDFLETATKAAEGGLTEVETSVDALSSVVNAYGPATMSAKQASDALFTSVRLGKTTFGELAASISTVAPIASAAGLNFNEASAAFTTLTTAGVSTAESMTQTRELIKSLVAPTKIAKKVMDEYGITIDQNRLKNEGLAPILAEIFERTGGNVGEMSRMLGSTNALQAALVLGKDGAAKFNEILAEMQDAVGATDAAFDEMNKTVDDAWGDTMNIVNNLIDEIAIETLPLLNAAIGYFADIVSEKVVPFVRDQFKPALQDIIKSIRDNWHHVNNAFKVLGLVVQVALAPIKAMISDFRDLDKTGKIVVGAIAGITVGLLVLPGLFAAVAGAASAMWVAIGGPIGVTIAAFAAIGYAIYHFRREIAHHMLNAAKSVVIFFSKPVLAVLEYLAEKFAKWMDALPFGVGKGFATKIRETVQGFHGGVDEIVATLDEWQDENQRAMTDITSKHREATVVVHETADDMAASFGSVAGAASSAATDVQGAAGDMALAAIDAERDIYGGMSKAEQHIKNLRAEAQKKIEGDPFSDLNDALGLVGQNAAKAQAEVIAVGAATQIAELLAQGNLGDVMGFIEGIQTQAIQSIQALRSSTGGVQSWVDHILAEGGFGKASKSGDGGGGGGSSSSSSSCGSTSSSVGGEDETVTVDLSPEAESLFDAWSGKNELQRWESHLIGIYDELHEDVQANISLADFIQQATAEEEMDRLRLHEGVKTGFEYLDATTNSVIDQLTTDSDKRDAHDADEEAYWEKSLAEAKATRAAIAASLRSQAQLKGKLMRQAAEQGADPEQVGLAFTRAFAEADLRQAQKSGDKDAIAAAKAKYEQARIAYVEYQNRKKAEREQQRRAGLTTQQRVGEDLSSRDGFKYSSDHGGQVEYEADGVRYRSDPINAYIRSVAGITDLNSREAIAIRRQINQQGGIPDMAKGGLVMPRPGGTLLRAGEAGKPEAIIPLDRMGKGATINIYLQGDIYGIDDIDARITETANIAFARGALNA